MALCVPGCPGKNWARLKEFWPHCRPCQVQSGRVFLNLKTHLRQFRDTNIFNYKNCFMEMKQVSDHCFTALNEKNRVKAIESLYIYT